MTDRIEYLFLEIPNCKQALMPAASELDKVCYVLGHISEMDERPEGFEGEFFDLLFNFAEIVNLAPHEREEYIKDMTTERDRANQLATAVRKSREEGSLERARSIARNMLELHLSDSQIADITGLSISEIQSL